MRTSGWPLAKSISTGTLATPNIEGVTGLASTSRVATTKRSASSSARARMLGRCALQVAFHSAQNQTSTGLADSITSARKLESVTVTGRAMRWLGSPLVQDGVGAGRTLADRCG